jgi:hypothetical protein
MSYSPEGFIKGKITELIFDEMFRRVNNYTVILFGYEAIYPEIAQYARSESNKEILENIRSAPDYALISHNRNEVVLIEVKYRTNHSDDEIKMYAEKIQERWKAVSLFLATPQGFYLDTCQNIIQNEGKIPVLSSDVIDKTVQDEYLELLRKFIK